MSVTVGAPVASSSRGEGRGRIKCEWGRIERCLSQRTPNPSSELVRAAGDLGWWWFVYCASRCNESLGPFALLLRRARAGGAPPRGAAHQGLGVYSCGLGGGLGLVDRAGESWREIVEARGPYLH